jgi:hypothetical protein
MRCQDLVLPLVSSAWNSKERRISGSRNVRSLDGFRVATPRAVVAEASAFLASHGMTDRVSIAAGSFFESVPAGHDAYVLSHIIHDWDEDQCQTILRNCRRAIDRNGRLLIVEMVLPEGDTPHPGKMLDMMMLVGPGGQERTRNEYGEMLSRAGFQMTRVVPTTSDVSIVEAVPV